METLPNPLAYPAVREDLPLSVPQDPLGKTRWREKILRRAETDLEFRLWLIDRWRESPAFFAECCIWTFRQTTIDKQGRQTAYKGASAMQPWETWPVHDRVAEKIKWCYREGEPLVIAKSRDVRMTWWLLILQIHSFVFEPKLWTCLNMSRLEDLVDSKDPDSLFYRLEYMLSRLPPWLQMHQPKTFANLTNAHTLSAITGAATTGSGGVGGRKDMLMVDEAARHPTLQELWDATRDTCQLRILNSTPFGPGPFKDLFMSGQFPTFTAAYYDHPLKGRGAEWRTDETGKYTRTKGKRFIWTPWLEHEVSRRTPADIAANIMIDFDVASGQVFDGDVLVRLRDFASRYGVTAAGVLRHARDGHERDLSIQRRERGEIRWEGRDEGRGNLTLWFEPANGQPPASRNWCIFADVSNGLSQSNSVAAIGDANTGEKLGMFVSSSTDPAEFARVLAMLGLWLQGPNGPAVVGWESNGPGAVVEEHLVRRLKYPRAWVDPDTGKVGWHSDRTRKTQLLENLRAAYSRNEMTEPDEATLIEAGDYVWTPGGGMEPVKLREDRDARGTHGDRVIATAGLWMMMKQQSPTKPKVPQVSTVSQRWEQMRKKPAGPGWYKV